MNVTFTLKIESGNAAFGEDEADARAEVAATLRELADRLDATSELSVGTLRDVNGNSIGNWALDITESEDV